MEVIDLVRTLFYFVFIIPNNNVSPEKAIIGNWQVSSNYIYYNGIRDDNPSAQSISFQFRGDKTLTMTNMGKKFHGNYRLVGKIHIEIFLQSAPRFKDHSGQLIFAKSKNDIYKAEHLAKNTSKVTLNGRQSETMTYILKRTTH